MQQKDKEGRSPLSLASRELATKMIGQLIRRQEVCTCFSALCL